MACVLYEMLAGDPPHTGPTSQAVLVRILTETPRPVSDTRTAVPPHVAAVLEATILAPWSYYTTGSSVGLDIHPDGERPIAVGSRSNRTRLWMVVNWFDELRRLIDAGG